MLAQSWLNSSSFWLPSLTHLCHTIFNGQVTRTSEFGLAIVNRALGIMYTLATVGMGKRMGKGGAKSGATEGGPVEDGGADDTLSVDGVEGESAANGTDKAAAALMEEAAAGEIRHGIPVERLPNHEFVVGALNMPGMDQTVLRNLAALAKLGE
jgi:hypothetical protein